MPICSMASRSVGAHDVAQGQCGFRAVGEDYSAGHGVGVLEIGSESVAEPAAVDVGEGVC